MKWIRGVCVWVLFAGSPGILLGQGSDQNVEPSRLTAVERALEKLQREVAELSMLLRAALPPLPISEVAPFTMNVAGAATRGAEAAKVVLVEFTDFECPYCGRHAQSVYPELQRQFVSTGQIKYVVRNLPLAALHPKTLKAAEAAECAGLQGRYWEMHDRIFANQRAMDVTDFVGHSQQLALDVGGFETCLAEGRTKSRVQEDLDEAKRLGLTGTPVFFIGTDEGDGVVRITHKIAGAHPFPIFQEALLRILRMTAANN